MKRNRILIFMAIPVVLLLYIWLLTLAFELMRKQDDTSVIVGVLLLSAILLSMAVLFQVIKSKYKL